MSNASYERWHLIDKNQTNGTFSVIDTTRQKVKDFQVEELQHVLVVDEIAYIYLEKSEPLELDLNTGHFYKLI